ncbi:hypothetical protein ACCS37_22460 [Rhizobium ruizarguesonis]
MLTKGLHIGVRNLDGFPVSGFACGIMPCGPWAHQIIKERITDILPEIRRSCQGSSCYVHDVHRMVANRRKLHASADVVSGGLDVSAQPLTKRGQGQRLVKSDVNKVYAIFLARASLCVIALKATLQRLVATNCCHGTVVLLALVLQREVQGRPRA